MSNKSIDIYTLEPIVIDSSEHILLNALGGTLEFTSLIDKTTNNTLGNTIDAALADFVSHVRTLLNTPSGSGKTPPVLKGLRGADGQIYNLKPGGQPEIGRPRVSFTELDDGRFRIEGAVRNEAELRRLIKKKLERIAPETTVEDVLAVAEVSSAPSPMLRIGFNFGRDSRRCIAKMCCNLFAVLNRNAFIGSEFNSVRRYVVRDDDQNSPEPVGLLDPPARIGWSRDGFSTLDHIVGFYADTHGVTGVVTLFGHYQFQVHLSSHTMHLNKEHATYRVNAITGAERSDADDFMLVHASTVPWRGMSELVSTTLAGATTKLLSFLKGDTDEAFQEEPSELVAGHWPLGEMLTPSAADAMSREIAEHCEAYCRVHGIVPRLPQ